LRKKKAAANDLPDNATNEAGNEPSNEETENVTNITEAELNALRAIDAVYNALETRLDERLAQQMAWTEEKLPKRDESGYSFGQIFVFVILFLLVCVVSSLHNEAEERRRENWW
jgi:hypothetical protein